MDIGRSDYPLRDEDDCRSKAQFRFGRRLLEMFPYETILEEFIIPCTNGLSLDFWLPRLKWAFEIQGGQHDRFVKFFHSNQEGFVRQQQRDSIKKYWCSLNNISLMYIRDFQVDFIDILDLVDGNAQY